MEQSHSRLASRRPFGTRAVALVLVVAATSGLEGCNNASTQSSVPAASTPASGGAAPPPATIGQPVLPPPAEAQGVALLQSATLGAPVEVTAGFFGWRGPCQGVPPTRSAWQLADGPQPGAPCIFVEGPMPAGFGPTTDPGARVRVRGSLSQADGVRYVAAIAAEAAP